MKVFATLILWATAVCSTLAIEAPRTIYTPRDESAIESNLPKVLATADKDGLIKAWVFFTDKGFFTNSALQAKLKDAELNLTERARQRRLVAHGQDNLVDFYDTIINTMPMTIKNSSAINLTNVTIGIEGVDTQTVETDPIRAEISGEVFVAELKSQFDLGAHIFIFSPSDNCG